MLLDTRVGGGTAERTFQMSRFIARKGIACTVVTLDLGVTNERLEEMQGVDVTLLPCLFDRFYVPLASKGKISKIVGGADIIHMMNHWTLLNVLVYRSAKTLRKPYVVCPAGALPLYGRSKIIKNVYNRVVGYEMIKNAQGHVAISESEIDDFADYGVKKEAISIIPNGIDPDAFHAKDDQAFRLKYNLGNRPFILFVGRLNSIKGPDILLDSFCSLAGELPRIDLVFAGPDEGMGSQLRAVAGRSGLTDRVHFIDYIGGSDKSMAYHAAELLVIPSRQEAMSIVVLEAGVTGTPVLLTDCCGFDVEGPGGGLVVEASVDGIKAGLVKLFSEGSLALKARGKRLENHVRTYYTWDAVIDRYIALYTDILER